MEKSKQRVGKLITGNLFFIRTKQGIKQGFVNRDRFPKREISRSLSLLFPRLVTGHVILIIRASFGSTGDTGAPTTML